MAYFPVETKEAAPVATKPPIAVPISAVGPVAGMTADLLSEFRQKREARKQPSTTREPEVIKSSLTYVLMGCIGVFG